MKTRKDGRREKLNQDQIRWIIDNDTLESMSHLSLRKRADVIRERFNLRSFWYQTLQRYYHRYGVRYNKPNYKYWRSQAENNDLKGIQMDYVQKLVDHM